MLFTLKQKSNLLVLFHANNAVDTVDNQNFPKIYLLSRFNYFRNSSFSFLADTNKTKALQRNLVNQDI